MRLALRIQGDHYQWRITPEDAAQYERHYKRSEGGGVTKGIEATLNQIASGLQSAADGYKTLASYMSEVAPYELPQVIAQIPPLLWMFLCLLGKH